MARIIASESDGLHSWSFGCTHLVIHTQQLCKFQVCEVERSRDFHTPMRHVSIAFLSPPLPQIPASLSFRCRSVSHVRWTLSSQVVINNMASLLSIEYEYQMRLIWFQKNETKQNCRCGPGSLAAIKQGDVKKPYDAMFIFAEVNADKVYWKYNGKDSPLKLIFKKTDEYFPASATRFNWHLHLSFVSICQDRPPHQHQSSGPVRPRGYHSSLQAWRQWVASIDIQQDQDSILIFPCCR